MKTAFTNRVRPASTDKTVNLRFVSDQQRVAELTGGAVDLVDVVNFVHSQDFRVGAPGWACCGTTGINGEPSFFGITPQQIPGHCGTVDAMQHACESVARTVGGASRIMLHLGLHAQKTEDKFRPDNIGFENLRTWSDWENELQREGIDVILSWDPTLWGGPDDDNLTLGSPNPKRRQFFIDHCSTSLSALYEFHQQRQMAGKKARVGCNFWLSGFAKRIPADAVAIKTRVAEAMEQIIAVHRHPDAVDAFIEGKAPPTQQCVWMEVTNYDALWLARDAHLGWCVDDGHGYPTEPMYLCLDSAITANIPLAAHLTLNLSGADDDLTLGTEGHPRKFIEHASKMAMLSRQHENDDLRAITKKRLAALSQISFGCDMFERGIPPEIAMVQGIQATRKNCIAALLTPIDLELAALRSGDPTERALAIIAADTMGTTVDLNNCLAWWRSHHDLDPDWVKLAVTNFTDRVGK